jgi:hypothetical protein
MHVKGIFVASVLRIGVPEGLAGVGFINGWAVPVHPLSNRRQYVSGFLRGGTVRFGADIQKIVPASVGASDAISYDRLRRLTCIVGLLISPTIVYGHTGLPRLVRAVGSNLLLRYREIPGSRLTVINDGVRL